MPTQEDAQGLNVIAPEPVGDIAGRRDVDVQLRKSEEFNRSLMDASPDCVKVLDLDGRVLHMNTPGLCAMEIDEFGSVCGQEWQSLWPEDVRGDIERSVARSLGGEVSMFQAYCPTAKGTPKWWEITVSPVRDSVGGRVVQLLSISRDITQRKQAEDRLRESEAEFRAAFEQSAVGMAQIAATTGRFVRVNAKYCELTGYSAEELAGTSPLDLHFTDDRDAEATAVGQFLRGETALYDAETRYLRKDGKVIWVHVNSTMMCNAEGRPERTMAVIQDITTRKQAEEKLRESEERLRLAIRAGGLGIWETNIESGRRLWSPEAMAIFGLDLADGIGRFGGDDDELHSRVHPDDRHLLDHYRLDLIEAGLIKAEYRIVLPKGDIRWLAGGAMVLTRDPAGDPVTSIHIAADITARKQAETVLSDSEARMRLALDAAQLGVREVNLETNQAVTTTEAARILGFKVGEIPTSEAYRARIHPGDQEQEEKSWRYAVSDPTKKYSEQYRFLRPDGRWIWLATSGSVIFEGNRPLRMIAVIQDITDQKRRERDFAFLADLQADNATFARTADALKALGKRIAEHLSASGCNFIEIDRHAGTGKVVVDNVAPVMRFDLLLHRRHHFRGAEVYLLAGGRAAGD